jgi:membrane protease subunit HflK
MYQPGGRPGGARQPEFDFQDILNRIQNGLGPILKRLGGGGVGLVVVLALGLIAVIWAATGTYTISPGEQAALRLFGQAQDQPIIQTGLHWWWPGPVGKRDVVQVTETRRMEMGFRRTEAGDVSFDTEALMISGDLNIIDVRMVAQYNITDLNDYLFNVSDPGEQGRVTEGRPDGRTLKDAAEAALRLVVGQRSIGDVLAVERIAVEDATRTKLQEILDSYGTGINIISVELQNVQAPDQVRDAFDDVLRARQDKERVINEAQGFENQVLPEARGTAARIIEEAEAFKRARIARAAGEASQFNAILEEYQKSQEVTRERLYLEAMEEILPGITKFIISPDTESILVFDGQNGITPLPIGPNP